MKSEIRIKNSADECLIEIEGTIGVPEELQFEREDARVATYEKFRRTVERIAGLDVDNIVVEIRSTGGDVGDALLIYEALRQTGARITTRCYGYTASAATIIAQAASEGCREISSSALYLIHTSICAAEGNAAELEAKSELLRRTDERLAAIYAERSGRDAARFTELMRENGGNGRWLSPEEAVAEGLADTVTGAEGAAESSLARNIVRGIGRMLSGMGLRGETGPDCHSTLNFRDRRSAQIAAMADAARKAFRATRTLPREDPSCQEALRSANETAYATDARRFRKQ